MSPPLYPLQCPHHSLHTLHPSGTIFVFKLCDVSTGKSTGLYFPLLQLHWLLSESRGKNDHQARETLWVALLNPTTTHEWGGGGKKDNQHCFLPHNFINLRILNDIELLHAVFKFSISIINLEYNLTLPNFVNLYFLVSTAIQNTLWMDRYINVLYNKIAMQILISKILQPPPLPWRLDGGSLTFRKQIFNFLKRCLNVQCSYLAITLLRLLCSWIHLTAATWSKYTYWQSLCTVANSWRRFFSVCSAYCITEIRWKVAEL